jgi:hypothetical protein
MVPVRSGNLNAPRVGSGNKKTHKGNYADRQGEYENAMAGTVEDKES